MGMVAQAASDKLVLALMSALVLSGAIGGSHVQTDFNTFDIYEYKAEQINNEMKVVSENPSDENIKAVYYDLLEEMQWSGRHVNEKSATYEAYLEACNDILISFSKGQQADTTEMNTLYAELAPSAQESHKENVKINKDATFFWTT